MLDPLIDDLSMNPVSRWDEIIFRNSLVSEFLAILIGRSKRVNEYAAKMGVSRRTFYRLIELNQRQRSVPPSRRLATGRVLTQAQERAITDAIRTLPTSSRVIEVQQKVAALCQERRIVPPTWGPIAARFYRHSSFARVSALIPAGSGLIFDTISVDLLVEDAEGKPVIPRLAALIDSSNCKILLKLSLSEEPAAVADLVMRMRDELRPGEDDVRLAITARKADLRTDLERILRSSGVPAKTLSQFDRPGDTIRMIVGTNLGPLILRTKRKGRALQKLPLPISVAQAVLDRCLEMTKARNEASL